VPSTSWSGRHVHRTDAEQARLRDTLRGYFAGLLTPAQVTLLTDRHGTVYKDVVRRMGRDRWAAMADPSGRQG